MLLQWQTATETNNNYFTVQRSSNSKDWENIATVKGSGNSSTAREYQTLDAKPMNGINYYRIQQTDFNGSVSYSEVRSVDLGIRNLGISIYPNPASNELHINVDSKGTLKMYNTVGKQIATNSLKQGDNSINIQHLPQGIYIVVVENNNSLITKKIIKN